MLKNIPLAELHAHLEGTITPNKAREIAARNNMSLPDDLFTEDGKSYAWKTKISDAGKFINFLNAYDQATKVLQTAEDYTDITHDYLIRCADEGAIYIELIISADHGKMIGLSYPEMVDAIAKGIDKAKEETGIECRLLSACVRHFGPEEAINVAKETVAYPHKYVTGFTMAGDENAHSVADFKPAFDIACKEGGLQATAHAGEAAGPQSIRDARDLLGLKRYGHMVRITEDPELMKEMLEMGVVPEVCVTSNLDIEVYPDYQSHPLRKLFDAGFAVTLGSDDPSFFNTSISNEYKIAKEEFGFSDKDLKQITRNAINAAFVDEDTRIKLLTKLDNNGQKPQQAFKI